MNNIILLIFDSTDLKAIPSSVVALKQLAVKNLWVIHNPHLGLPYPDAAKKFDEEIAELETAKQLATTREDYASATKYRDDINSLKVNRDLAIKEGFKVLKPEELSASYKETFELFNELQTGAENILIEAMPDPLAKNQAFQYLSGQSSNWVDQFPHGEYAVIWAGALANTVKTHLDTKPVEPTKPKVQAPKPEPKQAPELPGSEYTEGDPETMPWLVLRAHAKAKGVQGLEKMNKSEILNALKLLSL